MAIAAAKAKDSYADQTIQRQTCQSIYDLIKNNQGNQQLQALYNILRQLSGGEETVMEIMEQTTKKAQKSAEEVNRWKK